MKDDGFNYLNPEDRRRKSESELFSRVATELERRTKLNSLEARGTLAIALKMAGFLSRDVGAGGLRTTVKTVLQGELNARGVDDPAEVCTAIDLLLRSSNSRASD